MLETIQGVESVDVNIDDLRSFVFGNALPEEIPNPKKVPEEYTRQIRSWDFDEQHNLIMVKRTDGVLYFRPRDKYLRSLAARDLHHLSELNLNNNTNVGTIIGLIPILEAESRNSKWK
ncbi:hypothetical protein Hanom_Chr09g00785951 [Helianthus anomalus]